MTVVFRSRWPDHDPILRDLRFAQRMGLVHPDDREAALGMVVDSDGMVRPGPLTVEDVLIVASRLMDDDEALS